MMYSRERGTKKETPCSVGPISQLQLLLGAPLTKVLLLQYGTANSSRLIGPAEQGEYIPDLKVN